MKTYWATLILLICAGWCINSVALAEPTTRLNAAPDCLRVNVTRSYASGDQPDADLSTTHPRNATAWGSAHLLGLLWTNTDKIYMGGDNDNSDPSWLTEDANLLSWLFTSPTGQIYTFLIEYDLTFRSSSSTVSRYINFILIEQPASFAGGIGGSFTGNSDWLNNQTTIARSSGRTIFALADGKYIGLMARNNITDPAVDDLAVNTILTSISFTFTQLSSPVAPCK